MDNGSFLRPWWEENYDIYLIDVARHRSPPIDTPSGEGSGSNVGAGGFFSLFLRVRRHKQHSGVG